MTSPMPPGDDRTESQARQIILGMLPDTVRSTEDTLGSVVLTRSLVGQVLDVAWQYQFDDDRASAVRALKELVEGAMEERELGVHE